MNKFFLIFILLLCSCTNKYITVEEHTNFSRWSQLCSNYDGFSYVNKDTHEFRCDIDAQSYSGTQMDGIFVFQLNQNLKKAHK